MPARWRGLELIDLRLAVDKIPQEFREAGGRLPSSLDRILRLRLCPRSWRGCERCRRRSSGHRPFSIVARDLRRLESSKARRKLSRLRRIVIHDSPAWKPSRNQLFVQRAVVILPAHPIRCRDRPCKTDLRPAMDSASGHRHAGAPTSSCHVLRRGTYVVRFGKADGKAPMSAEFRRQARQRHDPP